MPLQSQSETRHSKLIRLIINKDNPFAKMTEKDMLIFNPNYHAFLKKLKNKEAHSSELSRIMSQPYNADDSKKKKKQELALYAFMRTQQPKEDGNQKGLAKGSNMMQSKNSITKRSMLEKS